MDRHVSPHKSLFLQLCIYFWFTKVQGSNYCGWVCSWKNLFWTSKTWRYSLLSFINIANCSYFIYFSWLCNTQSFRKFLKVHLTIPVITFADIIFCFAVYCFSSVSVSLREKPKKNNSKESIGFRVRAES